MSRPDMCNHPAWKSVDEDTRECVYCGIRRRYPAAVTLKEETFVRAPAVPVGVQPEPPEEVQHRAHTRRPCDDCGSLRRCHGCPGAAAVPVVHPEPGDRAEGRCARCREPIWQGTDDDGALTPWWHVGGPRPHDHDASPLAEDATLGERVRAAFGPGSVAIHAFVDSEVAAAVAAVRADTARMREALKLIAAGGCSNRTTGRCSDDPNRSPIAQYGAEKWCDECIAAHALGLS